MTKIEELKELFKCRYCQNIMNEPIVLACGISVCSNHKDLINKTECISCSKFHLEPIDGYPKNHILEEMIKMNIQNISIESISFTKCKSALTELQETIIIADSIKNDPYNFIYNKFKDLRLEADYRREKLKYEIDNIHEKVIKQINSAENECKKQFFDMESLTKNLDELKMEQEALIENFNSFEINEKKFNRIYSEANGLKKMIDSFNNQNKNHLLKQKTYSFDYKSYIFDIDLAFGKFSFIPIPVRKSAFDDSKILNNESINPLISLCEFPFNQKWKIIYTGSIDGFEPIHFHKKCDSIKGTLTIVKSTNLSVFGGYTDQAWSMKNEYARDENSFIFSLNNEHKTPIKMKCINYDKAIYNSSTRGPVFGCFRGPGPDLCIGSTKGVSRLGINYSFPNNVRVDFCPLHFDVIDIEVYAKISIDSDKKLI